MCHGVPSPMIYRKQLEETEAETGGHINMVCFRNKSDGWKHGCLIFQTEAGVSNKSMRTSPYMRLFLAGVSVCPVLR